MPIDEVVLEELWEAPLTVLGFLAEASNHTALVRLGDDDGDCAHAIYKPRAGERPLWDFPTGTLCQREVAAFVVSEFLGWEVVPPTVLRDGPMGAGSVQLFVPHDPAQHYFVLVQDARHQAALARMALFDLLVNNADRKGGHVLLAEDGHLWGVDHGLTFHVQTKLRTVIWELAHVELDAAWRTALRRLAAALDDPEHALYAQLVALLASPEIEALRLRARALADLPALPEVDERRRPYPWPPL